MLKKMMLLATAVAAMAAFAIPATASAAHFYHNDEPIPPGGVNAEYTGPASFQGGIQCANVHATIHFETNSADVTAFTGTECVTIEELAAVCTMTGHATGTFPVGGGGWPVDVTGASTLQITGVDIDNPVTGGSCPFGTNITASGNGVTATTTEPGNATHVILGGTLNAGGTPHTVT